MVLTKSVQSNIFLFHLEFQHLLPPASEGWEANSFTLLVSSHPRGYPHHLTGVLPFSLWWWSTPIQHLMGVPLSSFEWGCPPSAFHGGIPHPAFDGGTPSRDRVPLPSSGPEPGMGYPPPSSGPEPGMGYWGPLPRLGQQKDFLVLFEDLDLLYIKNHVSRTHYKTRFFRKWYCNRLYECVHVYKELEMQSVRSWPNAVNA